MKMFASPSAPNDIEGRVQRRLAWYVAGTFAIALFTFLLGGMSSTADARVGAPLPRRLLLRDSILARPSVAVLEVDPKELGELYENPKSRGRRWERAGTVAFMKGSSVEFASPVGIRIHGDASREAKVKSLRLYFRRSLASRTPTSHDLGLSGNRTFASIVLHGDVRSDWNGVEIHYASPLGYDMARRLGILAAHTSPITLIINDRPPLPYVVTERIDVDFLAARFGHRKFRSFDTKDDKQRKAYEAIGPLAVLQQRFGDQSNWTLERINQVVDVDNLARWFLLMSWCGTRDELQGAIVHDDSRPESPWFWIAWDMDYGFGRKSRSREAPWRVDTFKRLFLNDPNLRADRNEETRIVLLRHLFSTSEPFRQSFARMFVEARDSLLTPRFIEERLAFYEMNAARHGVSDTRYQATIREFLQHRPDELRQQINAFLHTNIQ